MSLEPDVPNENIEIYGYLFSLETGLREFIIESLSKFGPRWYKTRLPGDILEKYRIAKDFERRVKWQALVPAHPLYYIDFPDLRKIIVRGDNWKEVFEATFIRKDLVLGKLSEELDFIRNKIAHNRKATVEDVEFVHSVYSAVANLIGQDQFDRLSRKCTTATPIDAQLERLRSTAIQTHTLCMKCEPLTESNSWTSIRNEWWFDETYLGHSVSSIAKFFQLVEDYDSLPRLRGSGHKMEAWLISSNLDSAFQEALQDFSQILES